MVFLCRKMRIFKKMPNQRDMIERLATGEISLPPLSLRLLEVEPTVAANWRADAAVEVGWQDQSAVFAVACKSLSTPRAFQDGLSRLKCLPAGQTYLPMLFLPYLDDDKLRALEQEGISGIDLCGNCVVIAPGQFAVYRSGSKNRFVSSAPIKNVYRKNTSMVSRCFLARPGYGSVGELKEEIDRRNLLVQAWNTPGMSLSTVSKALSTLTDDLMIDRQDGIRVLQPDTLLEKLTENYAADRVRPSVRLKVDAQEGGLPGYVQRIASELGMPIVASGLASVSRYAVMPRGDMLTVYCPRTAPLVERLAGNEQDRFPNLEVMETEDEPLYFDARKDNGVWWASPVQVFLELWAGDKRDREIAWQVKSLILADLERN